MRTRFLFSILLPGAVAAQCPFDPTISPASVVLCPNEQSELSTQEFDAYQWYKDGSAITGATEQTLVVDQMNDGGSEFTVEATLNGCTEMSPAVLVDGWMFLLPFVIHGGDEPYTIGIEGESFFCEGDTLTLSLGQPYTESIVWTRNGNPIAGETGTTLAITTSGSYTASAAPSVCPDYVLQLGVDVVAFFNPSAQPTISNVSDQLCASPEGDSYQWYLDGQLLAASNTPCIDAEVTGMYTVFVDYGDQCQIVSEPFLITGLEERGSNRFSVAPNPTDGVVRISGSGSLPTSGWSVTDLSGRVVFQPVFTPGTTVSLDLSGLSNGTYTIANSVAPLAPARVIVQH